MHGLQYPATYAFLAIAAGVQGSIFCPVLELGNDRHNSTVLLGG